MSGSTRKSGLPRAKDAHICPALAGSLASPGGRSTFRHQTLSRSVSPPQATDGGRHGQDSSVQRGGTQVVTGTGTVHLAPWGAFLHPLVRHLRGDGCDLQPDQDLLAPRT